MTALLKPYEDFTIKLVPKSENLGQKLDKYELGTYGLGTHQRVSKIKDKNYFCTWRLKNDIKTEIYLA